MEMTSSSEKEAEYHNSDFNWEELREEIEKLPSLSYHLSPHVSASTSDSSLVEADSWRRFHRRHSTARFFKERRYLLKEFPELLSCHDSVKVLEVGCGNGSTVLPILRARESVVVYACDCSEEILEKAKEIVVTAKSITPKNRFVPFILDFNNNEFPGWLFCTSCQSSSTSANNASSDNRHANEACVKLSQKVTDYAHENETPINSLFLEGNRCCVGGVDFITLIFTLSAVPFCNMPSVIQKCSSVLKPGGLILFRDYGVYDMTMLRFAPVQKVGFREYMRSDGTLSYFFSLDVTRELFCAAGLIELELEYCCVRSVNRRNGKEMRRVWVHGKFQKSIV
ncbi:Methyltransferase [Rhynchospora pubera]|uniref:tRNA N(3)-methylcytidine methyltransferase n=1 Tax=Rhynchospora pubera TaxID=906938 RepID=A0AAV8GMW8_9POAL|nr:Methyltransferase [Rhynchospora pubera]